MRRRRLAWVVVGLAVAWGGTLALRAGPREAAPTSPRAALTQAGKRLSRSLSARELTALAARGDRVLALLDARERDALSRGILRFRVDRPTLVTVAAPRGFAPFWLATLGFRPVSLAIEDPSRPWELSQKQVPAGSVELGVNALDQRAPAHYVVLLQSPTGSPIEPEAVEGAGWRVLRAEEGVSLAGGVDLPLRRLPTTLRGATLLQPSHDLRHATVLARGRVWKTHGVAGPKPDQVTVAFGAEAGTELVWSWRSDLQAGRPVVRVRPSVPGAGDRDPQVTEIAGTSRTVEVPELLNDPVVLRHTARVTGLKPDTAYDCSVGDGRAGGMSPWWTVRTGPDRTMGVHLLYMGDPQCGLEGWGKLLAAARARHPEAGALLIAGDLVDRGNERSNWDHFFLRASGVFETLPVMPAVGNHEYLDRGPRLYRAFFSLPANGPDGVEPGLVYSFESGDVFVAVLDSTLAVSSPGEARRQAEWLDARLAGTERRWKLVMFHHPLYASHPSRENRALRDAWVPVLDKHRVDLVLQGHDHAYLRTYPLRADRRVEPGQPGTVYVVSVSGDKYYDQAPRDYAEVAFTGVSTYQTIATDPETGRLQYQAWNASGVELDRVVLTRPAAR